jgi:hypothetical protein
VQPGRLQEARFVIRSRATVPVTGQAVPSVAPSYTAKYLQKTECFCFTPQTFKAEEQREFTVRFIVDPDLPPRRPVTGSRVLTRRDEASVAASDKLILAASRSPREAFLMADLYCRGAHGHVNQHGAVTYLEFQDTPLLTALGYNNREPAHANLLLVEQAGRPFPLDPDGFQPATWQQASLPTSRLPAHDASRPFHRRIDAVNFRITAGRRGVDFTAADLRLTGSGEAIVLDDLRSAAGWKGGPEAGDEGLLWRIPEGVHFLEKKGFAREFDCRDHPLVTFRWKLSNNDERARPIILRVHCADRALDYHVQVTQLDPTLVAATAEEREGIQRGTLRFTGWFTPDTTLDRELALTRSGVLVVRDILRPGPMAEGRVAGPIWHLAATGSPKAGPHWFASEGARMELVVWFEAAPGRDFGGRTFNVWNKDGQQAVFARETLHSGQPVRFVTVLVPHDRGTDAAAIAHGISIEELTDTRQRVRIGPTGDTIDF